jgi:hypothetical protein
MLRGRARSRSTNLRQRVPARNGTSASRSAAFGPPHARLLNKIFIEAPHWLGKITLLGNEPTCST